MEKKINEAEQGLEILTTFSFNRDFARAKNSKEPEDDLKQKLLSEQNEMPSYRTL